MPAAGQVFTVSHSDYILGQMTGQTIQFVHGEFGDTQQPEMTLRLKTGKTIEIAQATVHVPTQTTEFDPERGEVETMETCVVFIDEDVLTDRGVTDIQFDAHAVLAKYPDKEWTTDMDTSKWTPGRVVWGLRRRPLRRRQEARANI